MFPEFLPTVDLVLEPGRSGDGERYRLSNTYRPPDLLVDISNTVDDVQGIAESIYDAVFGGELIRRISDDVESAVADLREDLRAEGVKEEDGKWVDFGFEHYDKFQPHSTDTICIDPMHGRYIEEYHGLAMAHHAPSSVRPGDDWSAEPLRLEHVQSAELHIDVEDWPGIHAIRETFEEYGMPLVELFPEGSPVRELLEDLMRVETIWELHEVTLELNGYISTTMDVGPVTETTTIDLGYPDG